MQLTKDMTYDEFKWEIINEYESKFKNKDKFEEEFVFKFFLIRPQLMTSELNKIAKNIIDDNKICATINGKEVAYNIIKHEFKNIDMFIDMASHIAEMFQQNHDEFFDILDYANKQVKIVSGNEYTINLIRTESEIFAHHCIITEFGNNVATHDLTLITNSKKQTYIIAQFISAIIVSILKEKIYNTFLTSDLFKAHCDLHITERDRHIIFDKLHISKYFVNINHEEIQLYISDHILTIDEIKKLKNIITLINSKIEASEALIFDDFEYTDLTAYLNNDLLCSNTQTYIMNNFNKID